MKIMQLWAIGNFGAVGFFHASELSATVISDFFMYCITGNIRVQEIFANSEIFLHANICSYPDENGHGNP